MQAGECKLRGGTEMDTRQANYLLACLGRLTGKVPEWQPVALAALMQNQLRHLGAVPLLALLRDLERLAWYWVLCKTGRPARTRRSLQVSGSGTAAEAQALFS